MPESNEPSDVKAICGEAVVVAAHPDDEILWFSSLLADVREAVICYSNQASRPQLQSGRSRLLANYPLNHVSSLHLDMADVAGHANWQHPRRSAVGLALSGRGANHRRYEANYGRLRDKLRSILPSYGHVFTHNPWGEYGHEEHVQVFRAVEEIRRDVPFTLWVSNYVSRRSAPMMQSCIGMLREHALYRPTNKTLARQIKDVYVQHGCWTWYPDFIWQNTEAFLQVGDSNSPQRRIGRTFALNFVDIGNWNPPWFIRRSDQILHFLARLRNRCIAPQARRA